MRTILSHTEERYCTGCTPRLSTLHMPILSILGRCDAFIKVRQDSFFKVLSQTQEVNGPPCYLKTDWEAAKVSVEKLASLNSALAVCGQGIPISGDALSKGPLFKKCIPKW
ncbi:hypothetical protein [Heyndrickxia acidicola]|uniref:Uncharacterized protein n=1 Tax=Heyndrickxia acidicola TaxID=209389 RepID=A0ABU6MC29_9BACI|nr:hypothetical protein [Heyndrickxia acidicola]MED1201576.1 hypothetical protein [Heyndrickxia acidicola]